MERVLRILARIVSGICNPFYLVFIAFLLILNFTYLSVLPLYYKLYIMSYIFVFTIMAPMLAILILLLLKKKKISHLSVKENRNIPYALTLLSYYFGYLQADKFLVPYYMDEILLVAITVMAVNALVNIKWKISAHAAGMGAVTAGVVIYGMATGADVVWILCIAILLSGMLGSARMILKEHSLSQILGGYLNGFICTMIIV